MKTYLYSILLLLTFFFFNAPAKATHLRGGYIHHTMDEQNPRKVNFSLVLYTNAGSPADDPIATISMGDGINITVERHSKTPIKPNVDRNIYNWEYTFPASGTFTATWNGENRNGGILNLAAPSDQLSMSISTTLHINPLSPNRHGVQIKSQPHFTAYQGEPLRFNLLAYDLDGDSLGYELIAPLHRNGQNIFVSAPGHTIPKGFSINRHGEIYWENPDKIGEYAYAVRITQYRRGQAVGHSIYDMQFLVFSRPYELQVAHIENKDELSFTKDGLLLVKPGEKLNLKLSFLSYAALNWSSELQYREVDDLSFTSTSKTAQHHKVEFSFNATEELSRKQPYAVNFYYTYTPPQRGTINQILTIPILIWKPEPVELALVKPNDLPRTPEGHISSKPGSAVKLLFFAKNGLGHTNDLAVESSLRSGAEAFSFVTRDSADSQVGELIFMPSENQISATPYTITVRNTSMQLRTSTFPAATQELTLQVLVSEAMPTSSGEDFGPGKLKVYPNPVSKQFTLEAPDLPSLLLQFYDTNGKVAAASILQPGQNVLARPALLAAGLYFYTLTSRDKLVSRGKIVLQ